MKVCCRKQSNKMRDHNMDRQTWIGRWVTKMHCLVGQCSQFEMDLPVSWRPVKLCMLLLGGCKLFGVEWLLSNTKHAHRIDKGALMCWIIFHFSYMHVPMKMLLTDRISCRRILKQLYSKNCLIDAWINVVTLTVFLWWCLVFFFFYTRSCHIIHESRSLVWH